MRCFARSDSRLRLRVPLTSLNGRGRDHHRATSVRVISLSPKWTTHLRWLRASTRIKICRPHPWKTGAVLEFVQCIRDPGDCIVVLGLASQLGQASELHTQAADLSKYHPSRSTVWLRRERRLPPVVSFGHAIGCVECAVHHFSQLDSFV